MQKSVHIY